MFCFQGTPWCECWWGLCLPNPEFDSTFCFPKKKKIIRFNETVVFYEKIIAPWKCHTCAAGLKIEHETFSAFHFQHRPEVLLCVLTEVCVLVWVWMGGWCPRLKPCRLLFRWNGTQVTASELTCQSNLRAGREGRNGWGEWVWRCEGGGGGGVRGTDGIGATVAEPLPLIAAPDKEKYQIGNQSRGLRGFEIFWWTMDWSTCLSVRLSLRGQMGFWQSSGGWYER